MMGNMKELQDVDCTHAATSPATQGGSKRRRQLPISLTQGTAATATATAVGPTAAGTPQKGSIPGPATAQGTASPAVDRNAVGSTPQSKPRQRSRIRPPAAPAPTAAAGTGAVGHAAEPTGVEQQQAVAARVSVLTQAAMGRATAASMASAAAALAPSQAEQRTARSGALINKHTTAHAPLGSNSRTTAAVTADSCSWEWMLTAEQMLAATDEQLLQQCRNCLASAGNRDARLASEQQQVQQSTSSIKQQQQLVSSAGEAAVKTLAGGNEVLPNVTTTITQQQQQYGPQDTTEQGLQSFLPQQQTPRQPSLQRGLEGDLQQQPQQQQQQQQLEQQAVSAAGTRVVSPGISKVQSGHVQAAAASCTAAAAAAAAAAAGGGNNAAKLPTADTSTKPKHGLESLCSRLLDED